MRVSVDKDDPGYAPQLIGRVKVFFCGYERGDVITADEEKRMAVVFFRNAHGNLVIEGDEAKRETIYGDIRIEVTE